VDFGSTKTDNVVTYVTVLDVDNRDLSLRPGMTASASILAQQRQGVLLVPNAALRFNPASGNGAAANNSVLSRMMPRPPAGAPKTARSDNRGGSRQLWLLKDGQPVPLPVTAGITDGRVTEVSGEGLQAGMEVITGQLAAGAAR
jgi:HlyD family secretion protein